MRSEKIMVNVHYLPVHLMTLYRRELGTGEGFFKNKRVLITGGTGTFGRKCAEVLLREYGVGTVIIFSRDEHKQRKMSEELGPLDGRIRFFIGDIRDKKRLHRALNG
ncbi:hypothetical protein ADUPG1_001308, partial [Aduncisulcus paluster]